MNKTPSILVDTGFEVDQNGVLTEIVTPSVVTTMNAPTKIVFNGTTLNYIPSTAAALQEIDCSNITSLTNYKGFNSFTSLTSVKFDNLTAITYQYSSGFLGVFYNLPLVQITMPKLTTITDKGADSQMPDGVFAKCTTLTNVELPELITITDSEGGVFAGCSNLQTVSFPKLQSIVASAYGKPFYNCVSLTSVTFGSTGHPVTSLSSNTFASCTQSGLTITIYTQGGAALSGAPWGATNATIVYEEA